MEVGKAKEVSKVAHNPMMKTMIPAGMASSAPPLGSMLGQVCQVFSHFLLSRVPCSFDNDMIKIIRRLPFLIVD